MSIPDKLKSELNTKIRKAVRLYRKGTKIVLTKALYIEEILLKELSADIEQSSDEVVITKEK